MRPRRLAMWEVRFLTGAAILFVTMSFSAQVFGRPTTSLIGVIGALVFLLVLYARCTK